MTYFYSPRTLYFKCPNCGERPKPKTNRKWFYTKARLECECGVAGPWWKIDFNDFDALWKAGVKGWDRIFPFNYETLGKKPKKK